MAAHLGFPYCHHNHTHNNSHSHYHWWLLALLLLQPTLASPNPSCGQGRTDKHTMEERALVTDTMLEGEQEEKPMEEMLKEGKVEGYLLLENGGQICSPEPLLLLEDFLPYNFSVCLLLRPQGGHGRFFHYSINNTNITAEISSWRSERKLEVAVNGKSFVFNTSLETNFWSPLCLGYSTTTNQPWVVVHGEVLAALSSSSVKTTGVLGMCLGDPNPVYQMGGWVAGVSVRAGQAVLHHPASATCLALVTWAIRCPYTWQGHTNIHTSYFRQEELCSRHYHHFWLTTPANYPQMALQCEAMGGHLPASHTDLMTTPPPSCLVSWVLDCNATHRPHGSPSLSCPVLFHNGTTGSHFCDVRLHCSICIAPTWLRYTLYGPLLDHDKYYFLNSSQEGNIYFQGFCGVSFISRDGGSWVLRSHFDLPQWQLDSGVWPVGRRVWHSGPSTTTLTLTVCSPFQFSTHDGHCIPRHYRCDGKIQSPDESDELDCRKREVKNVILTLPHLPHNNDFFEKVAKYEIKYTVDVLDIVISDAELTKIKMLMLLIFKWVDPSLQFRDFRNFSDASCDEFWNPQLDVSVRYGKVDPKSSYKYCYVKYRNSEYLDINDDLMSRVVEGQDVELTMERIADLIINCNTSLYRYPFGSHRCSIVFFVRDTYPLSMLPTRHLHYGGGWNLENYDLYNITSEDIEEGNDVFRLTLELRSQYGYHLLTSFVPSILMFVISYITFFFPLAAFSERVMASLTALLVLAALFTQASTSYVKTTYFKLIDLWYTVIILLCFTVVLCNVVINSLMVAPNYASVKPKDVATTHGHRSAKTCNTASLVTLFLVFVAVMIGFILYAAEII